jgi:plastocyanin
MGSGDALRNGSQRQGGLVPYRSFADQVYAAPLLPFERDLISLIGCTEEEYKQFKRETAAKGRERPAEYAHIPDVECIPIPVLISLAIGIAFSAVGALLAPKPPQVAQQQQREQQSVQLASQGGRKRFNATSGFTGAAPLAEYGATVPIIFTRWQYRPEFNEYSGGVFVTPQLVWSRMFSYGGSQGYKAQYVVGEHGPGAPEQAGIFIGENSLAGLGDQFFAVYWSSQDGSNRLTSDKLIAGSRGTSSSGDPENQYDSFTCPTLLGKEDTGFCASFTPSNNRQLGAYAPILNGTQLKHNWRVISMIGSPEQQTRAKAERRKIAGSDANQFDQGMRGTGRGYTPCMGLVAHNGRYVDLPEVVTVNVGDTITFEITDKKFDDDEFTGESGVSNDDMDQRTVALREEADDVLQLGETFMVGRLLFMVIDRPSDAWSRDRGNFTYTLKCVEHLLGSNQIRLCGRLATRRSTSYNGVSYDPWWVGPANFPLLRVSVPVIRNTRPVETTEFGIRSNVWQQLNGICNFNSTPTPARQLDFDKKEVQVSSGTTNRYIRRASVFTILVRPAGVDENGRQYDWDVIGEQFVVVGQTPTDVYNYIRIKAEYPREMEFKFVPKCGADVRAWTPETENYWMLNGSLPELGADRYNRYGKFRLTIRGREIAAIELARNEEFRTKGKPAGGGYTETQVNGVDRQTFLPTFLSSGRAGNYYTRIFGDAYPARGQTHSQNVTVTTDNGRTITLRITAQSTYEPSFAYNDRGWVWYPYGEAVVGSTGNWSRDETFDHNPDNQNYWGCRYIVTSVGQVWVPGDPAEEERWFEERSQYADVSHFEEVSRSNGSQPEHEIVYVNESTVEEAGAATFNRLAMAGLALRASKQYSSIDQLGLWLSNGVQVTRFGWSKTIGPANKFSDLVYYLLTNPVAGVGKTVNPNMIDESGFYRTSKFLILNRIYFDGAMESVVNIRQYFGEVGPLHLTNFIVRNGRFTVEPALPTDNEGVVIRGPLPVAAIFTAGNIIEDSFSVEFLEQADRLPIRAQMTYRTASRKNELFVSKSFQVRWEDEPGGSTVRQEVFDMSAFCTTRHHAFMAARYMMSIKRRIDHIVKFKTTPEALNVAPGYFIRIDTQASPYSIYNNAVVTADGTVRALQPIEDGTYDVSLYRQGSDRVEEASITIEDGRVADPTLFSALFAVRYTTNNRGYYQIEEVGLDEDGLVEITASSHPTDSSGASLIVQDVFDESRFIIAE